MKHRPFHVPHIPGRSATFTYLALAISIMLSAIQRYHIYSMRSSVLHEIPVYSPLQTSPTLHFFTSPKPFVGFDKEAQLRAIRSWKQLATRPRITLLGNGIGYKQVANKYGLHHDANVDMSFLNVPLLSSMFHAINRSTADVVVFLNADILLFDDFVYGLHKISHDLPRGWLGIAARWDVKATPYSSTRRLNRLSRIKTVNEARATGTLHTYGGVDLWAWDTSSGPLIADSIPSFVFGRGRYDNWLTHQAIAEGRRAVVDLSEAVTLVHVIHDYHLVPGTTSFEQQFWSSGARQKFETLINSHLASTHGTFTQQLGTTLHAPLKLSSCYEPDGLCLFRRKRPARCRCENSPFVHKTLSDPFIVNHSRIVFCGLHSKNYGSNEVDRYFISGITENDDEEPIFGIPLVKEHIFQVIASNTGTSLVILVVADFSERVILHELVCSMRASGVFQYLVIAALDDQLYKYCITRGLPVYLSDFENSTMPDYNTFKEVARYQLMYEVLRLGKRVLSIEPATVFQRSPWKYLGQNMKRADIAILSPVPELAELVGDNSFLSTAIVYANPTKAVFELLGDLMGTLEREAQQSGSILINLCCGAREGRLVESRKRLCRSKYGTLTHLLDSNYFRPLEPGACPNCSSEIDPLALYAGAFSFERSPEMAIGTLRHHGINRIGNDMEYCTY